MNSLQKKWYAFLFLAALCFNTLINAQTYMIPTTHGSLAIWDTGGNGKPVLFVHGNSLCKEVFQLQFQKALTEEYRFIAIDLPGHGQSQRAQDPEKTYNLNGYTDALLQVMDYLQLHKPVLIGWSLGGHIVLNTLSKTDNCSGALITGTPPIEFSFQGFSKGFRRAPKVQELLSKVEFTRQNAIDFLTGVGICFDLDHYPFLIDAVLKADGNARKYLSESIAHGIGGDQKAFVETDDTPLCVILGKQEVVNLQYVTEEVRFKNLFNHHIYLIEHASHFPFLEQPESFNQILSEFLKYTSSI